MRATYNVAALTLSLFVLCPMAYAGSSPLLKFLEESLAIHLEKGVLDNVTPREAERIVIAREAERLKANPKLLTDHLSDIPDQAIRDRVGAAVRDLSEKELSLIGDREWDVRVSFKDSRFFITPSNLDDATIAENRSIIDAVRQNLLKRVEAEALAASYTIPIDSFASRDALRSALTEELSRRLAVVSTKDPTIKFDTSDGKISLSKPINIGPAVQISVEVSFTTLVAIADLVANLYNNPTSTSSTSDQKER
jgi:hypothetical protein